MIASSASEAGAPAVAVTAVAHPDRPEGAVDVADVGLIENRGSARRGRWLTVSLPSFITLLSYARNLGPALRAAVGRGARAHSRAPEV